MLWRHNSCYRGGLFNGGRMIMVQWACLMDGEVMLMRWPV